MALQSAALQSQSTTMRVLEEVAAAKGVDPVSLDPPLASVIDPDALEVLAAADASVAIEFSYADCGVVVNGQNVTVRMEPEIK